MIDFAAIQQLLAAHPEWDGLPAEEIAKHVNALTEPKPPEPPPPDQIPVWQRLAGRPLDYADIERARKEAEAVRDAEAVKQ